MQFFKEKVSKSEAYIWDFHQKMASCFQNLWCQDALHSSIHTGKVKQKRGGGKQITIGVHHSENGAYYANPVEFGHGGPAPAPAHPFVRPAFDTRADEAFSEIKRVLRDELKNR